MSGRGICIPGVPIIGNVSSGGAGGSVDLSDIDMLTETTDPRLKFLCESQHSYNGAGGLALAAKNVWPLEYQNGVAVGRHEPELQATNYVLHGSIIAADEQAGNATIITGPVVNGIQLYDLTLNTSAGTQRYIQLNTQLPPAADSQFTTSFYAAAGGGATASEIVTSRVVVYGNTAPYLDRRSSLNLTTGVATAYPGQESYIDSARSTGSSELYRSIMTLTAQSPVTRVGPRIMLTSSNAATETDMSALIGMLQVELGQYATSPIPTTDGAVTRARGFAGVPVYKGLTGIRLHCTNDVIVDYRLNEWQDSIEGGVFWIPPAQADWATRYIQRISYFI